MITHNQIPSVNHQAFQQDLAGERHWENNYKIASQHIQNDWQPKSYSARTLEHILVTEARKCNPESILEVGCGNSTWLPYLAKKLKVKVAGMDYSKHGCELALKRLAAERVSGNIYCVDLFKADPADIGVYDFVFSLGLVEHFTDLEQILMKLLTFVKPGGFLLTEIPNLRSIHGLLSWIWQPENLAKHRLIGKKHLLSVYRNLKMESVRAHYKGIFTLDIVAWKLHPRWPKLSRKTLPFILNSVYYMDRFLLRKLPVFWGIPPFAPYVYVIGRKSG